jgi:hypothetical protein
MIFAMGHPGHVWDQRNASGSGPKRINDSNPVLLTEGTSTRRGRHLSGTDPSPGWRTLPSRQTCQDSNLLMSTPKPKFTLELTAESPLPEISAKGWRPSRASHSAGDKNSQWHMSESALDQSRSLLGHRHDGNVCKRVIGRSLNRMSSLDLLLCLCGFRCGSRGGASRYSE